MTIKQHSVTYYKASVMMASDSDSYIVVAFDF